MNNSILVSAHRLMKNGVLYVYAYKCDVPANSIAWVSRGNLARYDTRQAFEQQHWARDIPVLQESLQKMQGAMLSIELDDSGKILNCKPQLTSSGGLELW